MQYVQENVLFLREKEGGIMKERRTMKVAPPPTSDITAAH